MTVHVITDSTCDLPSSVVADLGIQVLPLYIHVEGNDYLDGIDITREQFYSRLPDFKDHPRTAVPSILKFRAMYDDLAEKGATEVLSIHITATLSAVTDVARAAAAETHSVPVTVIDSRSLSLGTGFLVQTAAELAKTGHTVKEILEKLEDQVKRTYVSAALNTLMFLKRSGRMNGVVSTIGDLLDIKPIIKMADGVSGIEKVRTHRKALARLVEMISAHSPLEKIAFLYSGSINSAQQLMAEVKELIPHKQTWVAILNPVLGAHLGPGVVGFVSISKPAER